MTPKTLIRLAEFCSLAYKSDDEIKAEQPDAWLWHNSGADAFSVREDGIAYIVVRGTAGSYDWISNACAGKTDFDSAGRVHTGFDSQARHLFMSMFHWIQKSKEEGYDLYFGGHSLGAAVATILAAKCLYRGLRVDGILGMCSPRVGNKAFKDHLHNSLGSNWIRTQLCRDIVATIPPVWFGLGRYRHGGKHIYFDRNGNCHVNPSMSFQLHDRIWHTFGDFSRGRFARGVVDDHSAIINTMLIREHAHKIVRKVTIEDLEIKS